MKTHIVVTGGILLICLVAVLHSLNAAPNDYQIRLKSRTFSPIEDTKALFVQVRTPEFPAKQLLAGKVHCILQFLELPNEDQQAVLRNEGIILHDYIPFYIRFDSTLKIRQRVSSPFFDS